jgi:hypothetical protein
MVLKEAKLLFFLFLFLISFASPEQEFARVAKLVDALCSGRSARKGVLVRIQSRAHKN